MASELHTIKLGDFIELYFNEDDNSIGVVLDHYSTWEDEELTDDQILTLRDWIIRQRRKEV